MAGGLAIVLSGGGAKGAFQVGVLQALIQRKKVNFEVAVGTSTGAIQAAAVAQNDIPSLVKFWTDIKGPGDIYRSRGGKLLDILTGKPSLYATEALQNLLKAAISDQKIRATGKKLRIRVVNITTGRAITVAENSDNLAQWVYASCAMPFLFPPQLSKSLEGVEEQWVDGGVRDVTPLDEAMIERPRAILAVSGHWEAPRFTVNAGAAPDLLYDYYGFPEHTYRLSYSAPGDPALAVRVRGLVEAAGLPGAIDGSRGFDHGVFVPFLLVDPQATIPVVQLSLLQGLDPERHIALGRALASLRDEGVLIVGSGMSYHNLRGFGPAFATPSRRFDDWLTAAVTDPDAGRRDAALAGWERAPNARTCHPREEHLLPLMVVAGAGGADPGVKVFEDRVMDTTISAFRFG